MYRLSILSLSCRLKQKDSKLSVYFTGTCTNVVAYGSVMLLVRQRGTYSKSCSPHIYTRTLSISFPFFPPTRPCFKFFFLSATLLKAVFIFSPRNLKKDGIHDTS